MFFKILNTSSRSFDDRLVRHWRSRKEFSAYSTLRRAKKKHRMQILAMSAGIIGIIFACGVVFNLFNGKDISIVALMVSFLTGLASYGLSSNIKYDRQRLTEFIKLNERLCRQLTSWIQYGNVKLSDFKSISEFEEVFESSLSTVAGWIIQTEERLKTPVGRLDEAKYKVQLKSDRDIFKRIFSLAKDLDLLVGRTKESFFESSETKSVGSD